MPIVHTLESATEWVLQEAVLRGSSRVYEENGEVIAWMDAYEDWLDHLYCKRGCTGRGIGKGLLNLAKENSAGYLQLFTFQVNEGARRFYAREGFTEVYWGGGSGNEEGEPDVRLEWRRSRLKSSLKR